MKPIKLKIEGLHSFCEPQEIDFAQLCETGLFGIFGPTGSGKSTILDGITLALYGKVERASNNTQGIINHAADRVVVEFTWQIGAPGHQNRYRVERLYRRTGENSVGSKTCRLILVEQGQELVLADKEREVTQRVEEILGLNVEDFTRAVVLPQSKFDKFLTLQGSRRNEMLQRLFSLEEYGKKLNEKLKLRLDSNDKQFRTVQGELAGLGDASDEAVAQARLKLTQAVAAEQEAGQLLTGINQVYEEQKQVWQLQVERQEVEDKLTEHRSELVKIVELEDRLQLAQRAELIRPALEQVSHWEQGQITASEAAQLAQQQFEQVHQKEEAGLRAWNELNTRKAVEHPRLIQELARLNEAQVLEEEAGVLRHKLDSLEQQGTGLREQRLELSKVRGEGSKNLNLLTTQIITIKQELQALQVTPEFRQGMAQALSLLGEWENLDRQSQEWIANAEEKHQQHQRAEQEQQRLNQALLTARAHLSGLEKQMADTEKACPATEEYILRLQEAGVRGQQQVNEVGRCTAEIEQSRQQVATAEQDNISWDKAFQTAGQKLDSARSELEKAEKAVEVLFRSRDTLQKEYVLLEHQNLALLLAAGLKEGQDCPVCGSPHHPAPASQDQEQLIQSVTMKKQELEQAMAAEKAGEAGLRTARDQYQQALSAFKEAEGHCKAAMVLLQQSVGHQQEREKAVQTARGQLNEKLRELSLSEIQAELTKLENKLAEKQEARVRWQKELDKLQQQVNAARDKVNQAEKLAAAGEKECHNTLKVVTEARAAVDKLRKTAENKQTELNTATSALNLLPETLKEMGERLKSGDTKTSEYQQELTLREQEQTASRISLEKTEAELQKVELELSRLEAEQLALKEQINTKSTQIQTITGGKPAATLKDEVQANLEVLLRENDQAYQLYEACRNEREKARQGLAQATRELELTNSNLALAREKLSRALDEHQFVTSGEAYAALCPAEERADISGQIKAFREAEKLLEHKLKLITANLRGRSVSREEWENCELKRREAENGYQVVVREVGGAEIQLKDTESKNVRWSQLAKERESLSKVKERLDTLQKIFRGNSFVEFLAEEQISNVARAASERLKQMTRHRYALEVDSDGGFVMRDDANGGVRRPVSSLSGGETFMTSLALALALSAQIQLKGQFPLEFFFLDEGFGTLDSELLDKVMTTLEELPADRMTIGVISHVPEMRVRMARRLVVEPAQPGVQGTRVQFETS